MGRRESANIGEKGKGEVRGSVFNFGGKVHGQETTKSEKGKLTII